MKVILRSPLLTRTGYGEHGRCVLRALQTRQDLFDIYIQPLSWGQTSWTGEYTEERAWIDQAIEKTILHAQQGGTFDVAVQVTIPNEFETIAPINIGVTAGMETTLVSPEWIQRANSMNKVIVVSDHSKNVFTNTIYDAVDNKTQQQVKIALTTPIATVGYPVKTFDSLPELDLELETDFNFLTVAQVSPRKNVENTIQWFFEEFKDDKVGLILKGNFAKNSLMDRVQMEHRLKELIRTGDYGDYKCKLYLLHGDMTDAEMHSLYQHPQIKALLTLAHGEGFGLPVFEAAYSGMPVIAPAYSGYLDFLIDENKDMHFYDVGFDLNKVQKEAVWENIIVEESMWAYAREQSAKEKMRLCHNDVVNSVGIAADACNYAQVLQERFKESAVYEKFIKELGLQAEAEWLDDIAEIEIL